MFPASIRLKLTLWYVLTLLLILGVSSGVWYAHLSRTLIDQIDQKLWSVAGRAQGMGAEFQTAASPCDTVRAFIHRFRLGESYRIVDGQGNSVCEPEEEKDKIPAVPAWMLEAAGFEGAVVATVDAPVHRVRQMVLAMQGAAGRTLFLQIWTGLGMVDRALQEMRSLLLIFSAPALIAVCFCGWFLAGRFLKPVENITRAMRRINAENLNQRLPIGQARDEISRLAETFNSMLSRLEESFRKIHQFSADASHELRTPLTILKGETEVALRWAKQPEEFRKTLESSMEEIDRMGRIIEDLLILAKSEAGEKSLEIKEISLSDLLQELYLQARTLGEPKGIYPQLKLEVIEEIRMQGDELRLRQLFLNLISNAVKYTPEGGQVEIILATQGDEAVVAISDTGIGIPPEHLPHIFDRFYRIDEARNREDGGTGLGLAIVRSLAQAHDGRVEVTSVPGKGSTFTVYLPLGGPASLQESELSI
ncbi:MAG: heavy metal sensor histidine kinase [Syntrophotaleaceae bacterium]